MRNDFLAAVAAMAVGVATASAYDIKVDGIYYNIIDDEYLEVTGVDDYPEYYGPYYESPGKRQAIKHTSYLPNDYAGDIVIPDMVKIEGYEDALPVKTIRHCAFYGAKDLTSVTLPATIERIGSGAFAESAIKKLDMDESNVITIPNWMCYQCQALSEVELPTIITKICDGAFSHSGISEFTIPDSVKYIGTQSFRECENLTVLNGGKSVESFAAYCFDYVKIKDVVIYEATVGLGEKVYGDNPNLKNVISYKADPENFLGPHNMKVVFFGSNQKCTLWVPDESLVLYKSSERWTSFFNDIRPLSQVGIEEVEAESGTIREESCAEIFNLNGVRVATGDADGLPAGVYIVRQGTKTEKIIVR